MTTTESDINNIKFRKRVRFEKLDKSEESSIVQNNTIYCIDKDR